ncbi:MAG: heavy metal translocating P-type ATPase [Clostridia bacterium]|nr:heavy metal translocating P-type ATPase [Clostridia bacterium]
MKFKVLHKSPGRMRVDLFCDRVPLDDADLLEHYLLGVEGVLSAKVYTRTGDAIIRFEEEHRDRVCLALQKYSKDKVEVPEGLLEHSQRPLNQEYTDKLLAMTVNRVARRFLLPLPLRALWDWKQAWPRIKSGLKCILVEHRLDVDVLDGTALLASLLMEDFGTAGSVLYLLGVGELLEEWTHKKAVGDLASTMSLNVGKVWKKTSGDTEVLVPVSEVEPGDLISVYTGTLIPFDGEVVEGEAMVNEASLTGEPLAVAKYKGIRVFAGTAVEEGELTLVVKEAGGNSKYEQIVKMIEESEKLKSNTEQQASHLADRLVPYIFGTSLLTYALTGNLTRAVSVLMVDFSCALNLSMPIAVLSAIRECSAHRITAKGGKFLEAIADADTIVFDKTGTLTKAEPRVRGVLSFNGMPEDELLRMAACLEEHFPHSIANAVVRAAEEKGLEHEEMHSKVEYIVAHGIVSAIGGKRAVLGSYHFIIEDEHIALPWDPAQGDPWKNVPKDCSQLYFGLDGKLAAIILVEDPLREETPATIQALRDLGFKRIVMMTGDSKNAALSAAEKAGVDECYYGVLPEDKAKFVEKEKAAGHKVVMIGDGINDSPALSAADVGIAISGGAEIARQVADITINTDSIDVLPVLKEIGNRLSRRIGFNYRFILGFNSALIGLGALSVLQPAQSALLHNASTVSLTLASMRSLLPS